MRLMEDFFNIRFHEGGNAFDQVWKTFRRNGIISTRGERFFVGGKKCAVIAKARFLCPEDSYEYIQDVTLWEYCSPDPHAEIKAIHHIKKIDERATLMRPGSAVGRAADYGLEGPGFDPRSVDMIMSFSPCGNCAKEIAEFSKSHPRCPITLRFSTVYKDYKPHNRAGLRVLNSNKMITLRVFTNETTNIANRSVANVIVGALQTEGVGKMFLLTFEELEKVNHVTIAALFEKSMRLLWSDEMKAEKLNEVY
ncbi:hypothetical protein ANN_16952 [Periplaneta americana]|uniref:CMP/dCMP-type deaminase domain-containing protein n=1 Tax=Periplaneta americana TaxID=6978 RepID=A0ABQ8SSX0_PERAM|nr:hypothetical protein ANN_16952 [Periplaneta americana]